MIAKTVDVVAIEYNVVNVYDEDNEQEYIAIGEPEVRKVGEMFQISFETYTESVLLLAASVV